jgi:XTP/dITP diphosphohydrolase
LIATRNGGKLREIQEALQGLPYRPVSLAELGRELPEVDETGATLLENAQLKARAYARASGVLALADDSGLEVDALDGAPGVHSARWAGPQAGDADNNAKLLAALAALGDPPRTAVFRTVMVLAEPAGREEWVAGRCAGLVTRQPQGDQGFGYDPLFFVPAAGRTFAQMSLEDKNRLSHRGEALRRARLMLERW